MAARERMIALAAYRQRAITYGHAALSTMVCDRGMLIVDFFLATSLPYLIQMLIWRYVSQNHSSTEIAGFGYSQLIFYYAYALAAARLNNGYDIIYQLGTDVHEGKLEVQLTKPFPYPLQKFFGFLGESSLYFIPLALILFIQMIYFDAPSTAYHGKYLCGMAMLILLSQTLCFSFSFCVGLVSFWVVRSGILLTLLTTLSALLSGVLLPLDLWPPFLRPVMTWNPLRFMVAAPAELMVKPDHTLLTLSLLASLAYCVLFIFLARLLWHKGLHNYHSVGG